MTVAGCQNATVGSIVCGRFALEGENHGKPTYKRDMQVSGMNVMIYYWDDRDGAKFRGWWFGPKVGGDQVWAYHSSGDSTLPPNSGWCVPYDGPVDTALRIEVAGASNPQGESAQGARRDRAGRRRARGGRKNAAAGAASAGSAAAPAAGNGAETRAGSVAERKPEDGGKAAPAVSSEASVPELKPPSGPPPSSPEEEQRLRKVAEDRRRQEQKATLAIRRVIQKVRIATPGNFSELQEELQEILREQLESTGSQKQRMQEESDKGLEQARKRIEQVNEQQRREQERKEEEEKGRQKFEVRAKQLVTELDGFVIAAEAGVERLRVTLSAMTEAATNSGLGPQEAEQALQSVEAAGCEVRALTKACTDFIVQKGAEMKEPAGGGDASLSLDKKIVLTTMLQRINECARTCEAIVAQARTTAEAAMRRAAARQKMHDLEATFEQYDKDADDVLSRREVLAYARGHFKFILPEEALDRIWRHLVQEGQRGVRLEAFQDLNVAIGVARECQRDGKRRTVREASESVLKDLKASLSEKVKEAAKAVDEADRCVGRAEKEVQPFQAKAKSMTLEEMIALADATDAVIGEAREMVGSSRRCMGSLAEGLNEQYASDLRAFLKEETKQMELRVGRMDSRLSRATNLSHRFREQADKKLRLVRLDRLRGMAAGVLRHMQQAQSLGDEDFFEAVNVSGSGTIAEEEFVAAITSAGEDAEKEGAEAPWREELTGEVLSAIFAQLADSGGLSKEAFLLMGHACYRVLQTTVLTSELVPTTVLRNLQVGEALEALEPPQKEASSGLLRIHLRSLEDGLEGWGTLLGNVGSAFLEEASCGGLLRTKSPLELQLESKVEGQLPTTRTLREGELLEMRAWPCLGPEGQRRLCCRLRSDGTLGWLSLPEVPGDSPCLEAL